MTYLETIKDLQDNTTLELETARESYRRVENELAERTCTYIIDTEVDSKTLGVGKITEASGISFDSIVINIAFAETVKKFSLMHIIANANFITFTDTEVFESLFTALAFHNILTATHKEFEFITRQNQKEALKKAEAEQKAEAKYQAQKEKAIKDFDELIQQSRNSTTNHEAEFYYALGWLVNHIGVVSASMPDYLSSSFRAHFGDNTPHTTVDSKKRTTNGNSMKWTFGFKITLKKVDNIPSALSQYINSSCNAINNTSFIWDLVDNYNFQFGKKQDIEKITQTVPAKYLDSFNEGLTA